MRVRLTVKLAEVVNGIDLSGHVEGDVLELPTRQARLLLAEKWAELVPNDELVAVVPWLPQEVAADTGAGIMDPSDDHEP
jgi:hypothetical protein